MHMPSVIIRILLRYAAGVLVAKGLLLPDMAGELSTDQEIIDILVVAAGIGIGALTEAWYWMARKWDKPT